MLICRHDIVKKGMDFSATFRNNVLRPLIHSQSLEQSCWGRHISLHPKSFLNFPWENPYPYKGSVGFETELDLGSLRQVFC